MEHVKFPVQGFEFMNEPATDDQKRIIIDLAVRAGHNFDLICLYDPSSWSNPFSNWDAACMINGLKEQLGEPTLDGSCDCPPCSERREKIKTELKGYVGI